MNTKNLKLKFKRMELGLTQQELADKVGISRYYLSCLELGKNTNPSNKLMQKLATELGSTVQELFFE